MYLLLAVVVFASSCCKQYDATMATYCQISSPSCHSVGTHVCFSPILSVLHLPSPPVCLMASECGINTTSVVLIQKLRTPRRPFRRPLLDDPVCLCNQTHAEPPSPFLLHSTAPFFSFPQRGTAADKVLHHPDLGRTAGSMGCNRVWSVGEGAGTLSRAWPDTSPFRSITFPLSVLELPSAFVASFLPCPI